PASSPSAEGRCAPAGFWSSAAGRRAYGLIPVALSLLTSVNVLGNRYAFDDTDQVLDNSFIISLGNPPAAFTHTVWSFFTEKIGASNDNYYRPLFTSLFTINYAVFGTAAWGWHLVNLLIHAACALFAFMVCRRLTGRDTVAVTAPALFSVHPVQAESVAWISGITDPLMGLFLLPAVYFYVRFRQEGRASFMAASLGLFFLALLSKETAVALPLLVAYLEVFHFK